METDLFRTDEYKSLLQAEIKAHSYRRGYHSQLARAAGCQSSFLSQVIHGHVHLTADQASGISAFWRLAEDEEDYFFLALQMARASTPRLRNLLKNKMNRIKQNRQNISEKIRGGRIQGSKNETLYYSAWFWSVLHVIVSIPQFRRAEAISERLKLPLSFIEECLGTLQKMNMIQKKGGSWEATQKNIHLPRESPLIGVHHMNWRQQAALRAGFGDAETLHYSVIHALSREDFERVKNLLLEFVKQTKKIVEPSPEEEIIFLGFDCFKI